MRALSKFIFPHLQGDQQRQQMNTIIIVTLFTIAVGAAVGAVIFYMNKR